MRVLGIVGSMRKDRHTNTLVNKVIDEMKAANPEIVSEIVCIADRKIDHCKVLCSAYCAKNPFKCSHPDFSTEALDMMIKADAIVIGAPLYFRGAPTKFQTFIEKLIAIFFAYEANGEGTEPSPLKGKPCGLVGVAEYSNPQPILEYLHDFCNLLNMNTVRIEKFPYLGVSGQGEVEKDHTFKPFDRAKDLAAAILKEAERNA